MGNEIENAEDFFEMLQETILLTQEIKHQLNAIEDKQQEIIRQLFVIKANFLD